MERSTIICESNILHVPMFVTPLTTLDEMLAMMPIVTTKEGEEYLIQGLTFSGEWHLPRVEYWSPAYHKAKHAEWFGEVT